MSIARGLAVDQPIALVDTEHGSAEKYADIFDFDTISMTHPYHPDRFVDLIESAAANEYQVLILDSLSHAWSGMGGLLEIVDQIAARLKMANTFLAWKDATPIQNRLVEAIIAAPMHIIATMRSKQEYIIDQVERAGRTVAVPRKVGMAPIQRDGFEYEFDIFVEMNLDHEAIVVKTRCPSIAGKVYAKPGLELAQEIQRWLQGEPESEKNSISLSGPYLYLNGTLVDPTNSREVKAFAAYIGEEGKNPPSRASLKRWLTKDEIHSGDQSEPSQDAPLQLVSQPDS